jgi:putative ABC transport system permease protein
MVSSNLPVRADAGMSLLWSEQRIRFTPVGRIPVLGTDGGTTVLIAADSLPGDAAALGTPNTIWVVGGQAARAVAATPELAVADADTATRSDWLAAQRAAPLTTGLPQLVVGAAVALGVLGVLVVLLGAETSAPERGRTLATLRTLG